MTNEVRELIRALREGSLTLEEVAQRFRERTWPAVKPPAPESESEWAEAILRDPGGRVPDSFDDLVAAYDHGEITRHEYRVLAEAVAEAKRAQHGQNG